MLDGLPTRQCQANDQWSGQTPTCRRMLELVYIGIWHYRISFAAGECNTLTGPMNGQVSAPNQPVQGDTATFSCNTDYELVGAETTTCQSNGQWSLPVPTCQCKTSTCTPTLPSNPIILFSVIQCPELPNPENGRVTIIPSDRSIGSIATFRCNVGHQLQGQANTQCQRNKEWSLQPPTCQRKLCSHTPSWRVYLSA